MTQHITVDEVKEACRVAYSEGRLLAQDKKGSLYGYQVGGRVCAIGAALTPETLERIFDGAASAEVIPDPDHSDPVSERIGEFISWDKKEQRELRVIQGLHDKWLRDSMTGTDYNAIAETEATFKKAIEYPG